MCGICGFCKVEDKKEKIDISYIQEMNAQLERRGPDGAGEWMEKGNKCGLGHRRLSIIDLSTNAAQPMSNEDGSIMVAFNGEIYNHAELRKELNICGKHRWKTDHSDTEVILHAYEQWGISCLDRFRGMFAIALWDANQRNFYLVRDRIGIKPVYYTIENGILTFASEIKAILKVRQRKAEINEKALYDFLSFLTTPGEETLFKNIYKLRPATYLCIKNNGTIKKTKYWDVWDNTHPELYQADEGTITEALVSELRTSVKLRKEADVPVGIFLSGGIDSSTNAALFSESNPDNIKTFCICYDQDYASYKNENHYAKVMAEYCGAKYYEKLLKLDDLLDIVPEIIHLQDEPLADPVCFPVYFVSKLAREHGVTVAQVGEGSDELFWGYTHWKYLLNLMKLNDLPCPNTIKKFGYKCLNFMGEKNTSYTEYLRRASLQLPIFWSGAEAFYEFDKKHMISDRLKKKIGDYTSFEAIRPTYDTFMERAWEKSHLNWMSYADLNHRLPELLLMRVDKMSMGVSLECRVPFLDHKFVELAMSISQSQKTKKNKTKTILKKAVRGIIPDEIIDRRKQGFGVPIYDWFSGRLGEVMRREIAFFSNSTGLLDLKYLQGILYDPRYTSQIWYLYNLALWWKEFIA